MLLIRHGQSEFNLHFGATRRDPGIRDPALTAEGRAQIRAAAAALAGERLTRLIASPYIRALETAEILAGLLGLPIEVDARVGERAAFICDLGSAPAALRQRWPHLALDHLGESWWPALEESESALGARCAAFRRVAATLPDWESVAVVTHWGFIRGLTGLRVPNGAVLRIDPGRPERSAIPILMPTPPEESAPPPPS